MKTVNSRGIDTYGLNSVKALKVGSAFEVSHPNSATQQQLKE